MTVTALLLLGVPWLRSPLVTQFSAAAASDVTDNPLFYLLNFGVLGVWLFCIATGLQPSRGEMKAKDAEIDRLNTALERHDAKDRAKDQAVEALVQLMTNRTLPALATAVAEVPTAQQAANVDAVALGRRLEDALGRVERVLGDDRSTQAHRTDPA